MRLRFRIIMRFRREEMKVTCVICHIYNCLFLRVVKFIKIVPWNHRCAVFLAMIIESDLPAPFAPIPGVPPVEEFSNFATRQDDHSTYIFLSRPQVFARDAFSLNSQPLKRIAIFLNYLPSLCQMVESIYDIGG